MILEKYSSFYGGYEYKINKKNCYQKTFDKVKIECDNNPKFVKCDISSNHYTWAICTRYEYKTKEQVEKEEIENNKTTEELMEEFIKSKELK